MEQFSGPPNQKQPKEKKRKGSGVLIWGLVGFAVFSGLLMQSCKAPSEPVPVPTDGEYSGTVVVETTSPKAETGREEPEVSGTFNEKETTEVTETTEKVKSEVPTETTAEDTQKKPQPAVPSEVPSESKEAAATEGTAEHRIPPQTEPAASEPVPPQTTAAETQTPATKAPETQAPETRAPEMRVPETHTTETHTPETHTPETQAPETMPVPESGKNQSLSYPRRVVSSYVEGMQADLKASQLPDITKTPGFRDRVMIPDRRNTGPESSTRFKKFTESGLIGKISEEEKAAGKKPLFLAVFKDPNNLSYNINGYSNSNCAKEVIIEGYTFEDVKFYTTNDQEFPGEVTIIFRNCRFSQIQSYPGENLWLVLQNCQTEGNVAGNNIIMENCFLHANGSDAINPNRNILVRNSYIADLFRQASDAGAHIDGSQCFGDRYGGNSENIIFDNVRFSVPGFNYEGTRSYVNAAIANGMEYSKGYNFLFQNIVIDTGGRWFPIYNTGGETVVFKNIQVANGYTHIFYTRYVNKKAKVFNVEHSPGLYVTSVWKDSAGKTHFLCSNNNMKTDKVLCVKTDNGEYSFSIPRHPTPEELGNDPVFKTYRFRDLPYDLEFVIEENISTAEFYDGNRLIRSAVLG